MPVHPITMLDGVTTTTTGPDLGLLRGREQEIGAIGSGKGGSHQIYPVPYEIVMTAVGGTATVEIDAGPDVSTYSSIGSFAIASGATVRTVGRLTAKYIRAQTTAISGATVNVYAKVF